MSPALGAQPPPLVEDQASRLRAMIAGMGGPSVAASVAPRAPLGRIGAAPPSPCAARIIAVASGKGGVGKTNVSVNLCAALTQFGCRVVLLDGDMGLANADVLCGVTHRGHLGHVIDGSRTLEDILIDTPAGFRLAPGAAGLARFVDADLGRRHDILGRLAGLHRAADVVVIDCGAGIGSAVMSFVRAADLALIVATPEPTSIADAYALLKCAAADAARTGGKVVQPALVINQARNDYEAVQAARRLSAVSEKFLGFPLRCAARIPTDPCVPAAVRTRRPFMSGSPRSAAAHSMRVLGRDVIRTLALPAKRASPRGGILRVLFRRGKPPAD